METPSQTPPAQTQQNDLPDLSNVNACCTFTELVSPHALQNLLRHPHVTKLQKATLKKIKKVLENGCRFNVKYDLQPAVKALGLGRMYPSGCSLVYMDRDLRNALAGSVNHDIDLKSAHLSLALNLCRKHSIDAPCLLRYVDHREEVHAEMREQFGLTDDEVKVSIRSMQYLGAAPRGGSDPTYQWAAQFRAEMQTIAVQLTQLYPDALTCAAKKKLKLPDPGNLIAISSNTVLASAVSLILSSAERDTVLVASAAIQKTGYKIGAVIYDGFHVHKKEGERCLPPELLQAAAQAVKEKLGYEVQFVQKPMDSTYEFDNEDSELVDDVTTARKFVGLVGADNFKLTDRGLLVFDDSTGMWSTDETLLMRLVLEHKQQLTLFDSEGQLKNYGGNLTAIKRMLQCIPMHVDQCPDFWEQSIDSSIGKLLFSDGILDMDTMEFTEGFDSSVVFADRIDRPWNATPDPECVERVRKLLFTDPFTSKQIQQGVPEYQLKALGRTLYGDYLSRQSYWNIGETGTGKGLITGATTDSLGTYFASFNIKAMQQQPNSGADAAKQLSWVEDIKYKRGVFSNEAPRGGKLCGNTFKSLVSGGDPLTIRQNRENEHIVRNRSTPWIMSNDMPDITPLDDAVIDRISGVVSYEVRFTDTANGLRPDVEKRKDVHAKNLFKQTRYQDAMLHLVLGGYQAYKTSGVHERPAVVQESTQEWVVNDNSLVALVERRFTVTGESDDFVPFATLKTYIVTQCGQQYSDAKLGRELQKIQGVTKHKRREGRCVTRGYVGLLDARAGGSGGDRSQWDD